MKHGRAHLNKTERKKAVDHAEKMKYDKTHKKKGVRKGGARKGGKKGRRLAYD